MVQSVDYMCTHVSLSCSCRDLRWINDEWQHFYHLHFLSSMPYVKGQKYDIQFTFNRLPVQMEHRACERITSVARQEMRHVLFPQEESLDRRGEINKTVRQVLVGRWTSAVPGLLHFKVYALSNTFFVKFQVLLRSYTEQWTTAGSSEDFVRILSSCSVPRFWTPRNRKDCYHGGGH